MNNETRTKLLAHIIDFIKDHDIILSFSDRVVNVVSQDDIILKEFDIELHRWEAIIDLEAQPKSQDVIRKYINNKPHI